MEAAILLLGPRLSVKNLAHLAILKTTAYSSQALNPRIWFVNRQQVSEQTFRSVGLFVFFLVGGALVVLFPDRSDGKGIKNCYPSSRHQSLFVCLPEVEMQGCVGL